MARVQIEQLPYLAMKGIFKFLGLRDLIRCRAVCQQFKLYADEAEIDQLIVCDNQKAVAKTWHFTEKPIDFQHSISENGFSSIRSSNFRPVEHVRFLFIDQSYWNGREIVAGILNEHFKQLIHLEVCFGTEVRPIRLALPNLRVLLLSQSSIKSDSVVLDTPKLEALRCAALEIVHFEHPQTIKRLESNFVDDNFMAKFKNLEAFEGTGKTALDRHLFSIWKNLKELDITDSGWNDRDETLRASLISILGSGKIAIHLSGVRLLADLAHDQMRDYASMSSSDFQFKYYKLLRRAHSDVLEVDYGPLKSLVPELSADFFDKFPHIRLLRATGPVDRKQFEWFLGRLSGLRHLSLSNTSLESSFMDRLPTIQSQLVSLRINETPKSISSFDFILQFELLSVFKAEQPFKDQLKLAAKAFRQMKNFTWFEFSDGAEMFFIQRTDPVVRSLTFHKSTAILLELKLLKLNKKWKRLFVGRRRASTDRPTR